MADRGPIRRSQSVMLATDSNSVVPPDSDFRAIRTAASAQCLFIEQSTHAGDVDDDESMLSDYDLVNDAIQDLLLCNDISEDDEEGELIALGLSLSESETAPFFYGTRAITGASGNRLRQGNRSRSAGTGLKNPVTSGGHRLLPAKSGKSIFKSTGSLDTLADPKRERRGGKRVSRRPVQVVRGNGVVAADGAPASAEMTLNVSLLPSSMPSAATLCVVLDLDETLVWARTGPVVLRPHVNDLIQALHSCACEVIVWTAGVPAYVNTVLHAIARAVGRQGWFHHIISRHHRWYRDEGAGVKDVVYLGRPLEKVLVVENNPESVTCNPQNAVLVEDFRGGHPELQDDSLLVLSRVIQRLSVQVSEGGSVEALLRSDPEVARVSFKIKGSPKKRVTVCGLTYSPRNTFAGRVYGSACPLPVER